MQWDVRILHLDDNPADVRLVKAALDHADQIHANVNHVSNKEQYLKALVCGDFDVILSDYRMPGFNGDEALKAAREICPDVPFIMVTGELGEAKAIETLKHGAADYVLKDNLLRLPPAVERALAEAENERRRKEAEEALRRSEKRLQDVIDGSPSVIFVKDLTGRFVAVNRLFEQMSGKKREDIYGKTEYELFSREGADFYTEYDRQVLEKGMSVQYDEDDVFADGKRHVFVTNKFPLFGPDGKPNAVCGMAHDITERKQAEEERERLLASAERYRRQLEAVFHAMSESVIIFDMEGNIVLVNEAEARLNGHLRGDETKLNARDFASVYELSTLDGTLLELADWPISRILRGESVTNWELHARRRDTGAEWFFSFSGQPVRDETGRQILGLLVTHDISRLKKAEETLRASEERFRLIADTMPVLVWTAGPDGVVDYGNRHSRDYSGLPETTPEGGPYSSPVHPDDQAVTEAVWQKALRTGGIYQIEHRLRRSDGTYRWHLSRALPVRDQNGNIIKWYGTATDIHEIREAHAELEKQVERRTRELEMANRELESFSYSVSHDLKAPLRIINGFAELLARGDQEGLKEKHRDAVRLIVENSRRMGELINALLEFSRIGRQVPQRSQVNTRALVESVINEQRQILGESANRVVVEMGDLPDVYADPVLLRQVFVNLLSNAFKFTRKTAAPKIEVGAHTLKDEYLFRVHDNGVGFPKGHKVKLFAVFQRLHSQAEFEGTGVGLATVRRIIERHGGQVCAEGEPDQGAAFFFTLPIGKTDNAGSPQADIG